MSNNANEDILKRERKENFKRGSRERKANWNRT